MRLFGGDKESDERRILTGGNEIDQEISQNMELFKSDFEAL